LANILNLTNCHHKIIFCTIPKAGYNRDMTILYTLKNAWAARLHFAALLFTFGELVAWQEASEYGVLDWIAILIFYIALSAITLDLLGRYQTINWQSILLVGGIFGLLRSALVTTLEFDISIFAVDLVFLPMGVETLMFVFALMSYQFLASGKPSPLWGFLLSAVVGLAWGIWARWGVTLNSVNITAPDWSESLPYVVILLVLSGIFQLSVRAPLRMNLDDWRLTPYGGLVSGGVLSAAIVIRASQGHIDTFSVGLIVIVVALMGFMLRITQSLRQGEFFESLTPPKEPAILSWLQLMIPFALFAWAGYNISGGDDIPFYADILFQGLLLFGLLWLPVVSTWLGAQLVVQLTREGY